MSPNPLWTKHATRRFASLNPTNDEINEVANCMGEVLAGKLEGEPIPFDGDLRGQFVLQSGRFGVIYRPHSKSTEATVTDVIPLEDWLT